MTTNYTYHPFFFPVTHLLWDKKDKQQSYKSLGVQTLGCLITDFYIGNFIVPTLGNFLLFIISNEPHSKKQRIALLASAFFSVLCVTMLYGQTINLIGRACLATGNVLNLNILKQMGKIGKAVGATLLFMGGTLFYRIGYTFPKYIIFSLPHVNEALKHKIESVKEQMFIPN